MAYTAPTTVTNIDGLQGDSAATGGVPAPNVCVAAGRQLCFAGQSANTSGGSVANQAAGTFGVPSGTANGSALVIANTLVGAASMVFLQLRGNGGTIQQLAVTALAPGASFTVTVYSSGATTAAVDCWYLILN